MFKRLRIAILLLILFCVALNELLAGFRSRDWNDPLRVDIHLVNGDGSATTQGFIDGITPEAFSGIERFFAEEAHRYGVGLEQPFRIWLAGELEEPPPVIPPDAGWFDVVAWSLKMRWFVTKLNWANDGPTPDITLFAIYEDGDGGVALDRSTALRKGMIVIAHLFARREMQGSNEAIAAHEILHTLGALDKYDLSTGQPHYPIGFAEPDRSPLYPQTRAELMGGRIPLGPAEAVTPHRLNQVMVGPYTAREIGWTDGP